MTSHLVQLMAQLGMAAITLSAKIVVSGLGTAATARELEKKLIAGFREGSGSEPSVDFPRSVEILAASARSYAHAMVALAEHVQSGTDPSEAAAEGHEPARQLGNAAVAFTMQLTVRYSGDSAAAREAARQMEEILLAKVNEAYASWRRGS